MINLGQCFGTTDWNAIGACGQWASSLFSLLTAAALIWIAARSYYDTKRQNKLQMITLMNDMVNDWDKTVISRSELIEKLDVIRDPVLDHETDNLIFMYLNFAHTVWYMKNEKLIDAKLSESVLQNAGDLISGLPEDLLTRLLARGYEPDFSKEMKCRAE
ncbi:MAG: hypothetical protein ACLQF2_12390 [Rhodomicrobium sp.]